MLFGPGVDIHELPVEQPTTQGSVAHERREGGGIGLERSGVRLGLLERQNSGIRNYQKLCCNHLGRIREVVKEFKTCKISPVSLLQECFHSFDSRIFPSIDDTSLVLLVKTQILEV